MKKQIIVLLISIIHLVNGQEYPPPTDLISVPTAGTLMRGSFSMDMRIQDEGGLVLLIGDENLEWYPRPEAKLKYLIFDENLSMPALALGLNTQGSGDFVDTLQRYEIKALGLYGAMSKNWKSPLGNIGLHTGLNYSFLETEDGDSDPNLFFGMDVEFNPEFSFLLEYNSALNENGMTARTMSVSKGGYLNAALRWSFVESLHLELHLNNLLFDDEEVDYFKRELKITYIAIPED